MRGRRCAALEALVGLDRCAGGCRGRVAVTEQVRAREFHTGLGKPLSVAVACDEQVVVAAGFLPLDELVARAGYEIVDDDLGAIGAHVQAWLEGEILALEDVPVRQRGTVFQEAVWAALRDIPVGGTLTYGEVAQSIGYPGAARAVGTACGANRIAPFVPCHRVVPAQGGVVGHYGYGSDVKAALIATERSA